jgi:hypothetical protein
MKKYTISIKVRAESLSKAIEKFDDMEVWSIEQDEDENNNKLGF